MPTALPMTASESSSVDDATSDNVEAVQKIESLIITTKAHQTYPAIRKLLPRISSDATIVLLQNGMGVYEHLIHDIFRNKERRPHFVLAANTHGAYRKDANTIVHAAVGSIQFGIVPDPVGRDFEAGYHDESISKPERFLRLTDIEKPSDDPAGKRYQSLRVTVAALMLLEQLNVSWKPISEVQLAMRRKLVVNAVINPLTAIMGCRNGDIFTTRAAASIMNSVCQESSDVFAAQHRAETQNWLDELPSQGIDPESAEIGRLPLGLTPSNLRKEVWRVAQATRGNISSMLSDVRLGRPTEIDYINGYLLRLGSMYSIDMPATATLMNLVKMRSSIPLDQML
ncbi:hypothetical protein AX17_000499 [Amanita inopinata Kibby_2008]|nr:hypothetical protein AX17_000499 [Amanita inopinata Kibby_2008]